MKKMLLLMLLFTSPLMAQEKEARRDYYKRPVFGLNFELGYSIIPTAYSGLATGLVPEFYIGKNNKVYFYLQLPLQFQGLYTYNQISNLFGLGMLLGMGGYILEADNSNRWSLIMNGAIGGKFLFGPTEAGQGYNGTSTILSGEGVVLYLDFLARYHITNLYSVQFGPTLTVVFPIIPKMNITFKVGLAF